MPNGQKVNIPRYTENELPVDDILNMKRSGLDNSNIVDNLQRQNFNPRQINEALNQADIKSSIRSSSYPYSEPDLSELEESVPSPGQDLRPSALPQAIEAPSQNFYPQPQFEPPRFSQDQIQQLVESVVKEKWEELTSNIGNIVIWKEKVKSEIISIKQEIIRFEERFENLQKSVLGKVDEYSSGIKDVGSEIRALEKVLQKILVPLTDNIKELERVTSKIKKAKGKK